MPERIDELSNAWSPDDPEILEVLRDATYERVRMVYSSNYVLIADLAHPGRGPGLAVYKPQRGERPLSDFPYGSLHDREVAAFELSRLLGWELIPPTIARDGPEGPGSLQLFIEHDPDEHYFELLDRPELHEQMQRLAVFDLVANNADRKGGHLLLSADGRLWGIDNALCFHRHEKLRTVIWDFAGEELPERWQADLRRVLDCLRGGEDSTRALRSRLREPEVAALEERIGKLLAHPVLPEMYPWRCVPWPMV